MPKRTAFIFAHPGHEFRLLSTIQHSPSVINIFTCGSRHTTSTARIDASRNLATRLGATTGPVFGSATDRLFYDAILDKDVAFFETLVRQLTQSFLTQQTERVILDSWQNYNPIHDLTHLCGRLAASRFEKMTGRALQVFDYPVVFGHLAAAPIGSLASTLTLDAADSATKLRAINAYPDIADDALALFAINEHQALQVESLHHMLPLADLFPTTTPPLYEAYGRERVACGNYTRVITWADVEIIACALQSQPDYNLQAVA